jgi:hypothetical protein
MPKRKKKRTEEALEEPAAPKDRGPEEQIDGG